MRNRVITSRRNITLPSGTRGRVTTFGTRSGGRGGRGGAGLSIYLKK